MRRQYRLGQEEILLDQHEFLHLPRISHGQLAELGERLPRVLVGEIRLRLADKRRVRICTPGLGCHGRSLENLRAHEFDQADHSAGRKQQRKESYYTPKGDATPRPAAAHRLLACVRIPVNDAAFLAGGQLGFFGHKGKGRKD